MKDNWRWHIGLIICIVVVFHLSYGLKILNPTNINWLMSAYHDWGQHYLGWAFYRNEPWTFPLGEISALCYPAGTNVGYWDSIPLLAIFFKLFTAILPEDFQYLGPWLLFCHLLVALFAVKILRIYRISTVFILAAALLLTFNPVLVYRALHPALCAHWILLASLYYYLRPISYKNVYTTNNKQIAIVILSALINPYICMMVLGFSFILPFKHYFYDKKLELKFLLVYPILSCLSVLMVWFLLGMISFGDSTNLDVQSSYGLYGLNLNSLFNSHGFSAIFPAMPLVNPFQYEGYMYLGLGILMLVVIGFVLLLIGKSGRLQNIKFLIPLFLLAAAMAVFSITGTITYNGKVLAELPVPGLLEKMGNIFRASGRFFWLAYYLILLFFIILIAKSRLRGPAKTIIITISLALQAYDTLPLLTFRNLESGTFDSRLTEAKWNRLVKPFDRMITYPPFNNHLLNNMDYQDLCFMALKNDKAISTGYSARENHLQYGIYADSLAAALGNGDIRNNEIYITTPQYLTSFSALLNSDSVFTDYIDGYYVFYSRKAGMKAQLYPDKENTARIDSVRASYTETVLRTVNRANNSNDLILYNLERKAISNRVLNIQGWAFDKNTNNNKGDSIFVTINKAGKTMLAPTNQVKRPDVSGSFKKNVDDSGFSASVYSGELESGRYTLGLAIKKSNGEWIFTDIETIEN